MKDAELPGTWTQVTSAELEAALKLKHQAMQQPQSGREQLIEKVRAATLQDRNKDYGNPEDNFKNIADVWNWWFETRFARYRESLKNDLVTGPFTILPLDVAHMMTLMKMARLKTNPTHFDSQVDAAGYQACAADFRPKLSD